MNDLQTWEHRKENELRDWEHKEEQDFTDFVHETSDKLDQMKKLDLNSLALDEARELNHKLRDQTGFDLSKFVPQLADEMDNFSPDEEDEETPTDTNPIDAHTEKGPVCVPYVETLEKKMIRYAGYF